MTLKLAFGNVRRSAGDYAIYFVTIALGVALFYAFNALSDQAILFDAMNSESLRMLSMLEFFMRIFSVVVACVLGFLVVYANRFLIRRRKHEFGMYLLLGMTPGRVSRILVCEALIVGIGSLIVGIVAGIALSQGLAFATAALMATTMSKYEFIVSGGAIAFTALCFAVIFAVSALIDVVYIRRRNLANLLSAHQESEQTKTVRPAISAVAFIASLAILGIAYWQLKVNGLVSMDYHFALATIFMIVGTFLFFWSISSFIIALVRGSGCGYFKGLRAFTTRQISSKMSTTFMSTSVASIILFFALTSACTGFGLVNYFVGNIEASTQYDVTLISHPIYLYADEDTNEENAASLQEYRTYAGDSAAFLRDRSSNWDDVVKASAQLDYYHIDQAYGVLFDQVPDIERYLPDGTSEAAFTTPLCICSVSQYNATCELTGAPTIALAADECSMDNCLNGYDALAQAFFDNNVELTIGGTTLHFAGSPLSQPLCTAATPSPAMQIIVPDQVIDDLRDQGYVPTTSYLNVMYTCDRTQGDELFAQIMSEACPLPDDSTWYDEELLSSKFQALPWPVLNSYTAAEMTGQAGGLRMIITYLALYIGFVLLMATATILAIQQLSECNDSLPRYRTLSVVGCPQKKVLGSLRTQTLAYFIAPLVPAIAHSICAITILNGQLFREIGASILEPVALTAGLAIVVYGIYMFIVLAISKKAVRSTLV